MKQFLKALFFGLITLGFVSGAVAQERGTRDEALAVVKAGLAYYKANGKDKTIAEANKADSSFRKKDLYLFIYDENGINLAHSNPKMVGKDLLEMRDANGVYINKEFIKLAKSPAKSGWLKYDWPNAISKKVEPKESYIEAVDGLLFICGYYR